MEPIEARALRLTKNYLEKAFRVSSISVETLDKYELSHVRDNGPFWKKNNQPTILEHLDTRYTTKRAVWEANASQPSQK